METVNIRELLSRAGFTLTKSVVPPLEEVKHELKSPYYDVDYYPTEHVGKPCFILKDTVTNTIRNIYLGNTFSQRSTLDVIDTMGVFTEDLLFNDIIGEIFGTQYDTGLVDDEMSKKQIETSGNIEDLYDYIREHELDIGSDFTYLYALVTDDVSYFEELTD